MTTPPLILIADDETHIVNVLAVKLQSAGYGVLCAHDGGAALRIAIDRVPDLIITDFMFSVLDGRELCKQLLVSTQTASIPVVIVTGHDPATDADVTRTTNIRAVIGKPFSPRDVLNQVNEILKNKPGGRFAKAS